MLNALMCSPPLQRTKAFPERPAVRELGFSFGQDADNGRVAPAGTPASVVQRLHDAFRAAMENPK